MAVRIAIVGAGLIGRCHAGSILAVDGAEVACIVDPSVNAKSFAQDIGVKWFSSINDMFDTATVDGVILATPSALHLQGALACIDHRCPVLVEKPLCVDVAEGETLVARARAANVPILTGHHRRHGPALRRAKELIDAGTLGRIVSFQGTCWFHKPADYFDMAWRRGPGGGPVAINLIHDLNAALHLLGDVASVHAMSAHAQRGGPAEDTAAVLLRFENGALGTLSVTDTAVSPWSWEMSSGENPDFPAAGGACYQIAGTRGALSVPDLVLWRHEGTGHWLDPIHSARIEIVPHDPLMAQIRQFAAVIRGEEEPLVSGEEGLRTLRLLEAIRTSAATGQSVAPAAS